MNKLLKLECITEAPTNYICARVQRSSDGLYYDPTSKTFKEQKDIIDILIPLKAGEALDQWKATAFVEINPKEFLDGEYSIYYHDYGQMKDGLPKLFEGSQVVIIRGDVAPQRVPTATENASRLLSSMIGRISVKALLAKLNS